MHLRPLRIAAQVELISLVAMLTNLATVHLNAVSSLLGPTHGCAYLFVVAATWRLQPARAAVRAVATVPGVGGLLALRRLSTPGSTQQSGDATYRPDTGGEGADHAQTAGARGQRTTS
ncbi:hypothetical protein [Streptomyces sp. RKAG290]|uniref:hypothetical protein n=1 Tax=Streptomyces sp. RKAG290 TaxID=2888348 RepID=UPI002033853C|nr:hypothetical protein [Streptomyces sp. RKAG290]MCM2416146.1 hypothetical protein [Streptomyces sp. RKAG290]